MSLVCIRIDDAGGSRDVTDAATRLTFTRQAPGGYVRLKVTLDLPLATFTNLGPASKVIVTDPRSGRTLWEGWAEYPGERHTRGGESWDLTAVGNSVLAYDQAKPVVYIDRDLAVWTEAKAETMPQSARAEVTDNPRGGGGEGLFTGLPKGTTAGLALQAQIGYSRIREAGMRIGGLSVSVTAGRNDGDYRSQLTWTTGSTQGSAVLQSDSGIYTDTSRLTRFAGAGGVHPPAGTIAIALRIIRVTSGGAGADIPDDTHWLWHTDPVIIGQRMDQWGNLLVGSAALVTPEYVRADWVVADVIGRYLPSVGADLARIDYPNGGWPIDQFVFPEPARAGDVLDALTTFEPDMVWELLETVEGEGVRFNYRPWTIGESFGERHRYELQMDEHQVDLPASDVELCDRVAVRWTDSRGRDRTTVVTTVVPDLVAAGRSPHDAPAIDLPDGIGSAANAQRAGERYLASLNARTVAGTALVKGRLRDRHLDRTVEPYEVEAGYLVLIREKGQTVRLTNVEYDDDQQASTLTLGTPQRTQDQVLATIASRARVKRRAA